MGEQEKNQEKEQSSEEPRSLAKAESDSLTHEAEKREEKVAPDEVISGIEQMPPEVKKSVQAFMAMFSQVSGPRANPLFEKFNESHIDKYLDYVQRDDDHEYELRKTNRWFYLGYAVLVIVIFSAAVMYLLPRDKEFLNKLIEIIIILAGGVGAGYGLKSRRSE